MKPSKSFHLFVISIYYIMASIYAEPLQGHNIVPAEPNEFPFIASIGVTNPKRSTQRIHICTGSLVSSKHVLTAEHCLRNVKPKNIDVIIGVTDLETVEIKHQVYSWVTYNKWSQFYKKSLMFKTNDLAVIKLLSSASQNPVELTTLNHLQLHRTTAIIAGWGVTDDGTSPKVLQKAKVKILSNSDCLRRYKLMTNTIVKLHGRSLCTAADPHTLLSKGDSGGPLLNEDKVLLGINTSGYASKNWGNFSDEFINKYKFNFHPSVEFYKEFILNVSNID